MNQRIWIFGGTSAIAEAWARTRARQGDDLLLIGRDLNRLDEIAADLKVRGAQSASTQAMDLGQPREVASMVRELIRSSGVPDIVLAAQGLMHDQARLDADIELSEALLAVNLTGVVAIFDALAPAMAARGHGVLVGIGSVAGDRGKRRNYMYGASKGALAVYLEGLRARLGESGARAILIKLGPVDTPMTIGMAKGPLWTSPKNVAVGIDQAILGKGRTVYLPWYWRPIMATLRALPERLFARLDL
jgi:short-subunit dehydrogenase